MIATASPLLALLEPALPKLEALRDRLDTAGDAAAGAAKRACIHLSNGLSHARGGRDSHFFKLTFKELKSELEALAKADVLEGDELVGLLPSLVAEKKGGKARAKPESPHASADPIRDLVFESTRAIARGDSIADWRVVEGGECKDAGERGWAYFDERQGQSAAVLEGFKRSVTLRCDEAEVPGQVFKELNKALTKVLGKPTGGAKSKRYKKGAFQMQVSRSTQKPPGGAYPFDIEELEVKVTKGKVELDL